MSDSPVMPITILTAYGSGIGAGMSFRIVGVWNEENSVGLRLDISGIKTGSSETTYIATEL